MSKSTETPEQKTAVADANHGKDVAIQLQPVFRFFAQEAPDEPSRVRFWIGFAAALAGIIAADTSPKDAELAMGAAMAAVRDGLPPTSGTPIH